MRGGMGEQRVAVGVGLGDDCGAERAAGADPVFEDESLAEVGSDMLENRARHDVGRAAGAEWNDDVDRLGWIFVLRGGGRHAERDTGG